MSLLSRRRAHGGTGSPDSKAAHAVPMLPAEATALIVALRTVQTLERQANPNLAHRQGVADQLANAVLTDAGAASTLGHQTVPLLTGHLAHVDSAVRDAERLAPGHEGTLRFRLLRDKLTALIGTARVNNWWAIVHPCTDFGVWIPTCTWAAGVPDALHTAMPRLVAGLEREITS